jgi:predicted RNA-binding protein with PUA-like domain
MTSEATTMWLLKTEPSEYSYADLEKDGRAVWDGVKNPVALKNLGTMKPGDRAFVYHTGDENAEEHREASCCGENAWSLRRPLA